MVGVLVRKPDVVYFLKLFVPEPGGAYEIPSVIEHSSLKPWVVDDGNVIVLENKASVVNEADCHWSVKQKIAVQKIEISN